MNVLTQQSAPRQMRHAALRMEHSINRAGQTITEPVDEAGVVAMELKAGSFSMHHELCVHRSSPNNASHRRIGIGLNYIPPHVRTTGSIRMSALLVRGEDRYGHFDLIDSPKRELDAEALAVHEQVSNRYRDNYNEQLRRHAET